MPRPASSPLGNNFRAWSKKNGRFAGSVAELELAEPQHFGEAEAKNFDISYGLDSVAAQVWFVSDPNNFHPGSRDPKKNHPGYKG
jgi:hypothetical protein